ncbi:type II toxin-antitoxin system RelE/ParE family toxin [Pseudidiomarina woesei]|uniref:type II toxin-antitoxin system RelE/ParE family toxin n=1 Tax=Pseudidiomarina woesei TaxID=1381080 RepID=UPI0011479571
MDDLASIVAATELSQGLHDGNLDMGKLYKKRIASPGQSKRDSNRTIEALI